jgi:hypothetical protein
MAIIGVQMIHSCGHSGYHVVEQLKDKAARALYDKMGARPCPACLGKGDEFIVETVMPPRKIPARRKMVRR